jgi:hypothetical protein
LILLEKPTQRTELDRIARAGHKDRERSSSRRT